MQLDIVEAYLDGATSDTLTFADEQSLSRWLAQQN